VTCHTTYSIPSETNLAIRSISPFNVYSFSPYIAKKRSSQNYISNHKPIHKFVYNIVQKIPYFYRELLNCTCVRRFGAKVFILCISYLSTFGIRQPFRDGPLVNLWGQGGGIFVKGEIRRKKFKRLENSPPPPSPAHHSFSNGPYEMTFWQFKNSSTVSLAQDYFLQHFTKTGTWGWTK